MSGAGAAGTAVARLLVKSGAKNIIAFDKDGAINASRSREDEMRAWFIEHSNPTNFAGDIHEAMSGADVFIGVSVRNTRASLWEAGWVDLSYVCVGFFSVAVE